MMADLVRSMTPKQMTAAYDRGSITHAEYLAALDYHRREVTARVRANMAPAALLDGLTERMTGRDGLSD